MEESLPRGEEIEMEFIDQYVQCDKCQNKDFKPIYEFAIRCHGVNFSDELMYDEMKTEKYQCTKCSKTFTKGEMRARIDELKSRPR